MMRKVFRGLFIAAALTLTCGASIAAPTSLDFGGSTLQRLRASNTSSGRFTEYGRKNDEVAETLTVRMIAEATPFEVQVGKLVKTIRANNPKAKISVLQRPNAKDVIVSYLADRPNSNVSYMLWRMTATNEKVVAAIYQMDFDIGDEDAKERVIKHTAERALAAYDSVKMLELVSD
jgi:hypothetical protein